MTTNSFFTSFRKKNNRKFRVLHIGNIANNGYLNSKILNQHEDVDSYALSMDYYHIMGCPEWEESTMDFLGINQNNPEWYKTSTYSPPDWFFQGSPRISLSCLFHKVRGHGIRYWFYKKMMELECKRKNGPIIYQVGIFLVRVINRLRRHYLARSKYYSLSYWTSNNKKDFKTVSDLKIEEMTKNINSIYKDDYLSRHLAVEYQRFIPIFDNFDLIHCYGTDLKFPYLTGTSKYVGYEHGTIRDLPFENTLEGILCRKSYQNAKLTFITNSDNIEAAKKLDLSPIRVIPHPINNLDFSFENFPSDLNLLFQRMKESDLTIFHPSRQHWGGDYSTMMPSWIKANDVLIKGFADIVHSRAVKNPLMIMVNWGATIDATKELIQKLNLEKYTIWTDPLPHPYMLEVMNRSDVIADQFYLGAFGSITAKGLGVGKAVLVYLRPDEILKMFQEMPPVLNAKTPEEVSECLKTILDTANKRKIEVESKMWFEKYHSHKVILNKLEEGYAVALNQN